MCISQNQLNVYLQDLKMQQRHQTRKQNNSHIHKAEKDERGDEKE